MSKPKNTPSAEKVNLKKRDRPSNVSRSKTSKEDKKPDRKATEPASDNKPLSADEEKANKKKWAKKVHSLNCKAMSKEFNTTMKRFVPSGSTQDVGQMEKNELKSRYRDVLCVDQTRVVLRDRSKADDFIHANWVGAPGGTKFISTQAPLEETTADFWHMCYTEKVSLIIMLCNFSEGSVEKCSHYFPEQLDEKKTAGEYTVTMKEKLDEPEIEDTDFTVMEIKLKDEVHKLKHCFMRYWVDNCAPLETDSILKLWRWVRKYHADRPVVVHCSAGVGRTSTFVGIEVASYRIASNPDYPMIEIVKELRAQRYQAIQSHVQFLYLHYLVLDYFVQEKWAEPYKTSAFVTEYKKHTAKRTTRAKKQGADQGKMRPEESNDEGKSKKPEKQDSDVDN